MLLGSPIKGERTADTPAALRSRTGSGSCWYFGSGSCSGDGSSPVVLKTPVINLPVFVLILELPCFNTLHYIYIKI